MLLIQQISDEEKQATTLVLEDGSTVDFTIEFKPMQMGWFITNLLYKTFSINGIRIVTSPNILHQFKNQIPFGFACFVDASDEPTQQQDFSSERAKLYILTQSEVTAYEAFLSDGQIPA